MAGCYVALVYLGFYIIAGFLLSFALAQVGCHVAWYVIAIIAWVLIAGTRFARSNA
jgi:hypothetical protein